MKRTKSSLRETLDALTATLVAGILAAARDSLLEMHAEPAVTPRKRRAPRRSEMTSGARIVDLEPASDEDGASAQASGAPSDLVITDPSALLAALETNDLAPVDVAEDAEPREEPEILRPAPAPKPAFAPALRAGEEVMRTASSAVVLRRRRV